MKLIISIAGMHCASCAVNIEDILKKEKGVNSASVNLATEKAYLDIDTDKTSFEQIQATILKIGYRTEKANEAGAETAHGHHHDNMAADETKIMKKRFWFSLIFGSPIIYMSIGEMFGWPIFLPENYKIFIQIILSTFVVGACFDIWRMGVKNLFRLRPDMDSLFFIGTASAYFYSLAIVVLFWLKIYTAPLSLYFESAVFILIFISLGDYLEAITKGKTRESIKKLIGLQPKTATVLRQIPNHKSQIPNYEEVKTLIGDVNVGDIILVKPGEKIATDGIVIEGYSAVDEKIMTGESLPVEKKEGDEVIGSTINKTGALKFRATKVGGETMLAQIIKIVDEAMGSKAPIQFLADRISFYFVPAVIAIALVSFLTWLALGQSLSFAIAVFVTVLIVACPCALGLATPVAVIMGTGIAAQNGILIKSGKALEIVKKINIIVFDKTGTLTKGEPAITDIIILSASSEEQILQIAASIEKNSEHPLAQAILNKAKEKNLALSDVINFQAIPGHGVEGELKIINNELNILFGNRKLMDENGIEINQSINEKIEQLENEGKTVMILAVGEKSSIIHDSKFMIYGLIAVADTLKAYSKEAVDALRGMGKQIAMITGDNRRVAEAIGKQVGIEQILADVLPGEKSAAIKKLQDEKNIVAMVGDGINDAPALAQADLGIALGSGTDVAIETGEIILIKDDLRDVVRAINLSSYTLKKIKQNLFWAFFYNIITIPLAAGLLYPLTKWLLNPAIAAAAMAFSSVSVILNALLMKYYKFR